MTDVTALRSIINNIRIVSKTISDLRMSGYYRVDWIRKLYASLNIGIALDENVTRYEIFSILQVTKS